MLQPAPMQMVERDVDRFSRRFFSCTHGSAESPGVGTWAFHVRISGRASHLWWLSVLDDKLMDQL